MEFRLITPDQHAANADLLDQTFRLRHRVFNEWLKWNLPHQNGREIDAFDDTAFLFVAIEDGEVMGTWRAMPTTAPCFNRGVFPQLYQEIPEWEADSTIWDLSRMAVDRRMEHSQQMATIAGLAASLFEAAIVHGITAMMSVQDKRMTALANHWLGEPTIATSFQPMGDGEVGLFCYEPNLMRLYTIRASFGLPQPALSNLRIFDAGHTQPAVAATA